MSPGPAFLLVLAAVAGVAATLWRRAPRASTLVWLVPIPLGLWLFRNAPGLIPAFFGMAIVFYVLRANVARLDAPELSPAVYLATVMDLTKPLPREEVAPPAKAVIGRRALRGVLLTAVGLALIALGTRLQLWRTRPYLEDLFVLVEGAVGFTAVADLVTALMWASGRRAPDSHDGTFAGACSLRQFWRRWNGIVSRSLLRGIFLPLVRSTRRLGRGPAFALATLAVFGFSGLIHALPLLLATSDRALDLWLFGSTMAFFLLHGLATLLEGVAPARWTEGWSGRLWLWAVWAGTGWLYPGPLAALLGIHGRTFDSLTVFALFGHPA